MCLEELMEYKKKRMKRVECGIGIMENNMDKFKKV